MLLLLVDCPNEATSRLVVAAGCVLCVDVRMAVADGVCRLL